LHHNRTALEAMSENLLNADDLQFYANQLRPMVDQIGPMVDQIRPMVDQITKSFSETGDIVQSTVLSLVIRPDPVVAGTIEVDYDGTCNRIVAAGEKGDTVAVVTQPKPPVIMAPKRKKGLFATSWRKKKSVAPAAC
jgi:hypothetical protein